MAPLLGRTPVWFEGLAHASGAAEALTTMEAEIKARRASAAVWRTQGAHGIAGAMDAAAQTLADYLPGFVSRWTSDQSGRAYAAITAEPEGLFALLPR